MGIKSLFGFGQARDKPVDKAADAGYSFLFGRTTSGKPVNERTAMQTTAVYACVRILAEAVASLPLHVYEYQDDGGKKLVHDHPLYYLLHDEPNPEMTSFVFRETLMSHLLIWGNAYAQIIRDGAGRVLGLYPLLPDKMDVQRDDKGNIYYVYSRNSDENPMFKEYGNIRLKAENVLHIPGLGFDGLIGYSPIAMAKNAVGMTLACEEYGASFFANGANPGGVLEHPGVLKDPSKVRESWNSVYRGVNNAHKIAVLEEGMKYQQIGIPPEEAQFLETRKFQINEIARLYRIPPHMVGDLDKSSFSNIEQQSLEFVKYTLDPWVIRWEQSLQRSLLLPGEKGKYFIKLNVDGLLRGDYQSRMNGYAVGRQNGWFSANDIREMENMNPIPDGNITVWINSPGGDVFAAAQIYNMLRDYKGSVTVKIDGIAASAASVIAMAGDTVCVSPVAMMMIHNPATMAMGEAKDMQKAIAMLNEVKESILNAYEFKTGLTRARLSHMMDDETWFNAKKAVELGFADKILFDSDEDEKKKKPDEPEEKPEEGSDGEEGEKEDDKDKNGKKKLPFQQDSMMFSTKAMNESFLSKVSDRDAMIPFNQLEKRLSLLAH
mgnify:CR=1 FL=1